MSDNPFRDDNVDFELDDVNLLGASSTMSASKTSSSSSIHLSDPFADESVQRSLQQAELDINRKINAAPVERIEVAMPEFQSLEGSASDALLSGRIDSNKRSSRSKPSEGTGEIQSNSILNRFLSCLPCFSLEYYQTFFNVDTQDVVERCKRVFMPWKDDFFQTVDANPDLYSPFWICTTLILLTAVTSNLSNYLATTNKTEFKKDVTILTWAMTIVYGFALAMPAAAYLCFQYLAVGSHIKFTELLCVYGYSLAPFVAAAIICIIPVGWLEWVAIFTAFFISAIFLLRNLWVRLQAEGGSIEEIANTKSEEGRKMVGFLLVGLIGLHLVFSFIVKTMFFSNAK